MMTSEPTEETCIANLFVKIDNDRVRGDLRRSLRIWIQYL